MHIIKINFCYMEHHQLETSSIFNLLLETGIQRAEGRVQSKSLNEEMSLIGFIPYTENYLLQKDVGLKIDLNGHLCVAPYLIRFSKTTPVYPYFKTITKASGKKYSVDSNLNIDRIWDIAYPELKNEIKPPLFPLYGDMLLKLIKNKLRLTRILLEQDFWKRNEKESYEYIGRSDDFELNCGLDHKIAISNDFLCLCSYMNRVTGTVSYAVLTSNDTIRVMPEK